MYQLIDGKKTAADIRVEIAAAVREMKERGAREPHLAAILVGTDGGSETYVAHKVKDCGEVGFESTLIRLPDTVSEEQYAHLTGFIDTVAATFDQMKQ